MQHIELYRENASTPDELVERYSPLVRKIACHLLKRLPSSVELDDMIQSGMVGLLEAGRSYRVNAGSSFETWAGIRIMGSIVDGLRKNASFSRRASADARKISTVISQLEQVGGGVPAAASVAAALGLNDEEYQQLLLRTRNLKTLGDVNPDSLEDDAGITPHQQGEKLLLLETVQRLLVSLPQKEQQVLSLYYMEELTFRQIGEVLNLTEARICQLHARAIAQLRKLLEAGGKP